MAWRWTYEVAGEAGASAPFPTQAEAEAWLGEEWATLADVGVSAVTLMEDDRVVYGPMSLDPA